MNRIFSTLFILILSPGLLFCQPDGFILPANPVAQADAPSTPIIFYGRLIDRATSTPIIYPNIIQQLTPSVFNTRTNTPPILRLRAMPPSTRSQYLQLRTNVKGEFEIQTEMQELSHITSMQLETQKHLKITFSLPESEERRIDLGTIYLEPRIEISGRLIDAKTKQPINLTDPASRAYIYPYSKTGGYISARMTPREDGNFTLANVADNNIGKLTVRIAGYITLNIDEIPQLKAMKMNFGDIEIPRSPRLRFELFDTLTKQPYVPASRNDLTAVIAYSNNTGQFLQRTMRTFKQESKGVFEAELTVQQVDQLLISVTNRQPVRLLQLPEMKDDVLDVGRFELEPVQMVFGRLNFERVTPEFLQNNTVNEDVITGYTTDGLIIPLRRSIVVRESGIVQILEPPKNLKAIELWVQGFLPKKIIIPPANNIGLTDLGIIPLKRGCIIKGKAVGPKDETVIRGTIFVMGSDNLQHAVHTDSSGNFELSGFKPGKARVIASVERKDGNMWLPEDQKVLEITNRTIKIKEGTNKLNLRFELPKR